MIFLSHFTLGPLLLKLICALGNYYTRKEYKNIIQVKKTNNLRSS